MESGEKMALVPDNVSTNDGAGLSMTLLDAEGRSGLRIWKEEALASSFLLFSVGVSFGG